MNKFKSTPFLVLGCAGFFALGAVKNSSAAGLLKVESNGFLRRAEDRADSSSTISIGPDIAGQGKYVEGKLDLEAIIQVSDTKNLSVDRNAFTMEAANAYFATSKKLMPHHQATLGRRVYNWSRFDDEWQFGTYSPRFIWDPTRPETVGLTGIFYTYESKHWRALVYGSPINIPERGYPLRNENGRLTSTSPFAPTFPESTVVAKRNLPIRYTVEYPPMNELVANPGAMTSVRYSTDEGGKGLWVQGLYGYLPVHQPNVAVEPLIQPPYDVADVKVHPEIQRHHLLTFETGFQHSRYALWGSVTEEIPTGRSIPSNWVGMSSAPATLVSAGGDVLITRQFKFRAAYILVSEKTSPEFENQDFKVDLGSRFPYHRAAKAGIDFYGSERITYSLGFVDDFANESQFASFDVTYRIYRKDSTLTLNVGTDFFASATGKGYIGQYQGNDRFRGGVSYAF